MGGGKRIKQENTQFEYCKEGSYLVICKRILLIFSLILFIGSCSSDDDNFKDGQDALSQEYLQNILGEWDFLGRTTPDGTEVSLEPCDYLFGVEFTPTIAFIYEYRGLNCEEQLGDQVNYSINALDLKVGDENFIIIQLTESLLIVEFKEGGSSFYDIYLKI